METAGKLGAYFNLANTYQEMFASYRRRGIVRDLDPNDKELVIDADWQIQHYYDVGADAVRIMVQALLGHGRAPPRSILDLPSGSGRVTRHLRAFFPDAAIVASDLYDYHVDFCRDSLGVEGLLSRENLQEIAFDRRFDLIFCGSLLTHLPEPLFWDAINLFARSLSETGIAVVTVHGRHSDHIQAHKWKYLEDRLYDVAAQGVCHTGFGYVDYQHDFRQERFNQQEQYGVALVRPHWLLRGLESRSDLRILGYTERYWDDHQDVLIFGRPGVND